MTALIEPVIPGLRRYARSMLRDGAAAADLVQDCLERAISRWHQRRSDGDTRGWLYAICHNLAINRLRQTARRGRHLTIDDAPENAFSSAPAQEQSLLVDDIVQAMDALPEDQRAVLLLVSVEDLSYAEAAAILDVPQGTVMSRLSRARSRLRNALAEGASISAPSSQTLQLRSVN